MSRIGILTFHRAINCGAMLQAWALRTVLERMGHTVEFPALNNVGNEGRRKLRYIVRGESGVPNISGTIDAWIGNILSIPCEDIRLHRYKMFRKNFLPERACRIDDLKALYDLLIVGSDQVWSDFHTREDAPVFFAETLPQEIPKIAYAASYGDAPLPDARIKRVVDAVGRFKAISVRETLAATQISRLIDRAVDETLDPTLLLTAEDYAEVARGTIPNGDYLFMYTLSPKPFFVNTAKELARRLNVKCVIAPCTLYTRYKAPKGMTYSLSPDRLVQFARNAKYVLAASFHGTVMGLIFRKPFLSLRGQVDEYESRPASLLRKIACSERIVNPATSIDFMEALLRKPVPESAYHALSELVVLSKAWLKARI